MTIFEMTACNFFIFNYLCALNYGNGLKIEKISLLLPIDDWDRVVRLVVEKKESIPDDWKTLDGLRPPELQRRRSTFAPSGTTVDNRFRSSVGRALHF